MKITLAIIDFVIVAMALQGLVLSIMLFLSSRKIGSNRYLAVFLFVISYSVIAIEVFTSSLPAKYPWLIVEIPRFRMALGPLLYFYTRSLLYGEKKLPVKSYFHFSALLIEWGPQLFFLLYTGEFFRFYFVQNIYHTGVMQYYFFGQGELTNLPFNVSLVIYMAISYKMVRAGAFSNGISAYKHKDIKWLKSILYIVFAVFFLGAGAAMLSHVLHHDFGSWTNNAMSFLVMTFAYCLGMAAYIRQFKMSAGDVAEYNKPTVKPHFSDAESTKYHRALLTLMETERIYLNPALKIDLLAAKLCVPEKAASGLLNQHVGKSFNDFVNEYRIAAAKSKLTDPAFSRFTIASIAYESGFNSLATFQRCFKQFTGITPSQFQAGVKPVNKNDAQIPI